MIRYALTFLFLGVLCSFSAELPDDAPKSVDQAIQSLSADKYDDREKATLYLWEKGTSVLELLNQHIDSDDPEIAIRVRKLIRNIRIGILPDTPPDIIQLVERYQSGTVQEKEQVFRSLEEKKAYKQLLHLFELEASEKIRKRLTRRATNAAIFAARQAMLEGRDSQALEYLLLAPASQNGMIAAADYYRQKGDLDKQIELAEGSEKENALHWKLALLRAKGDLTSAVRLAEELGEQDARAALYAALGDPVPFLQYSRNAQVSTPWVSWHLEIAESLWTGESHVSSLAQILNEVKAMDSPTKKNSVALSLFANGYPDKALVHLSESSPRLLFQFYESLEKLDDALAALGIDAYEKAPVWALEVLGVNNANEIPEDYGDDATLTTFMEKVLPVVYVFDSHGDRDMAMAVLDPALKLLKRKNEEQWGQVLVALFNDFALGELTLHYAEEHKVETGDYPKGLVDKILMMVDHSHDLMIALNKVLPDSSLKEIMLLLGLLPDKKKELEAIEEKIAEHADQQNQINKTRVLKALVNVLTHPNRREYVKASGLLEKFDDDYRAKSIQQTWYRNLLIHQRRWKEVEPFFKGNWELDKSNILTMANYGSVIRNLGRKKEGEKMIEKAISLSLGAPDFLLSMGVNLSLLGSKDYTHQILDRLLSTLNADSQYWRETVKVAKEIYFKQEKYKQAASYTEIYSHIYMDLMRTSLYDADAGVAKKLLEFRGKVFVNRGLDQLRGGDKKKALKDLKRGHAYLEGTAFTADDFFPLIRNKIPKSDYEEMYDRDASIFEKVMRDYPNSANVHNSFAWLSSRAMMRLKDAEVAIDKALSLHPTQAAYLDTKAEVEFAQKRRKSAIKYSDQAVRMDGSQSLIWEQNRRFRKGKFPEALK